jgi:hypothetical protein
MVTVIGDPSLAGVLWVTSSMVGSAPLSVGLALAAWDSSSSVPITLTSPINDAANGWTKDFLSLFIIV